MKAPVIVVSLISGASVFISVNALAKTASCPCSPCKCSPCTCGAGGPSKSGGGGKHHDKEHGRDHHGGGTSVGVGASVDLSGFGRREKEEPFAVGGGEPVAHTQEKHKPKTKEKEVTKTNPFDDINVNRKEAKGDIPPADVINVSDEVPQDDKTKEKPPKTEEKKPAIDLVEDLRQDEKTEEKPTKSEEKPPPPQPQEKQKKPKPTWPKPIQNWLDLRQARLDAEKELEKAQSYREALATFCNKSEYLKQLEQKKDEAGKKVSVKGATKQDEDAYNKAVQDVEKQKLALERDFANTAEGKAEAEKLKDAKAKVASTKEAEKEAAKDIDKATQDKVLKKMSKWEAGK